MTTAVNIIPIFVIVPLAGAFMISIGGRKLKWLADFLGVLSTAGLFIAALFALKLVNEYHILVYSVGAWKPPIGIAMVLDGLTAFMLVTVNLVALMIAIYSVKYMEHFTSKWKFFTLFLLMLGGMNGVIVTGDIFNLFVFLEIAAIASFALVAFGVERHELEAAFKYALMSTLGSLFVLMGIALLYGFTSTLNMADIAAVLAQKGSSNIILLVSVLFVMGFGLKSALVPFHAWLPDAHPSAPAPISAMLSGVLIKSLGIYTIFRIFGNVIGVTPAIASILMVLGCISMVVGGFLAIGQWDLKRLYAYSSISQMGYIILGFGIGTPLSILGSLFHLFNHSVFKSLLFLGAGAVEYATGTRDMKKLGGLMKKMPVTGMTSIIGTMSISGVPPFAGFWSKLIIILAAVEAGQLWPAVWAIVASVLTLAAFLKAMKCTFWGDVRVGLEKIIEVPFLMKFSLITLALITSVGGLLLIPGIQNVFLNQAVGVMTESADYLIAVLQHI
ncbi:MAG TPA: proton-conducting transporter membrane subunit [Candidatus Omnitrophota bacterium]|nr:proton-conducting transporter membrane subunit [Candidatus Omnitrophota bacterium]HPD84906.1 proton-conducting transporter membrane subunit [Candidatus Omnitrophota bacterium]HRZ03764.1 proton-conducting transporter membrane subunit [Candidatus Omnitrophota bacterium]